MKSRYNPVLLLVVLVGLCCALWLNYTRYHVEKNNHTVDMAMEYENLVHLAGQEGLPVDQVLKQFQEAGINSLMVFDNNLLRMQKRGYVTIATGEELQKAKTLGNDIGLFQNVFTNKAWEINAAYLLENNDAESYDDILEDLRLRYGEQRVTVVKASAPRIAKILGSTQIISEYRYDEPLGILQAPLGLPRRDMQKIANMGFGLIVRPQNYIDVKDEQIASIFKRIKDSGVEKYVYAYMPCGTEVVGYPHKLKFMGEKMQENKLQLVMLEHYTQLQFSNIHGLVPLAEAVNYNASRSYVIDGAEQKKITIGTALNRWALTDEERNIRVNYIRPFMMPREGQSLINQNLKYVKDIKVNVAKRGFAFGTADTFQTLSKDKADNNYAGPYFPNKLLFIPVIAAVMAGCVLYLSLLFNLSTFKELVLWAVLTAIGALVIMLGRGLLLRQLVAMGSAVLFPVLSMNIIMDIWDGNKSADNGFVKILLSAVWQLALAVFLSLFGGWFLSAILTDSRFLLEIDIYRGVKLTFVLPILMMAALFIKRYDLLAVADKSIMATWKRYSQVLDNKLSYKQIVGLLVLAFVAFYFVGRSGHTGGVPVLGIELKLRAMLEQLVYARPRTKEFLIGHPCFFIACWAVYRQWNRYIQLGLVCAAVIGQGSLVQTFCHMRTPVIMTFLRAVDGYAVALPLGIAALVGIALLIPVCRYLQRRFLV